MPRTRSSRWGWDSLGAWIMAFVIVAAALGGGSRDNPLRVMIVELACLPLLWIGLRRLVSDGHWREAAGALGLIAAIAVIPLLQLIPLPPSVWQALPQRANQVAALHAAGIAAPWLPFSLSPQDTYASLLALMVPAAMFIAVRGIEPEEGAVVARVWLAMGGLGLVLGAGQMVSPLSSPFYLYHTTNYGSLVGFFANRNHEATFLLCLLPFTTLVATRRTEPGRGEMLTGGAWALLGLIIVGLGTVHSRAGLILAVPALLGCLALVWRAGVGRRRPRALLGITAVSGAAIVAVLLFALAPNLARFSADPGQETRLRAWPHIEQAATSYLPFGSGVGSFDRVFRDVEPLDLVSPVFLNHAHNDYLELWLETGWAGAAVLAAVLAWLATMIVRAWARPAGTVQDLQRAASLAVLLILAHSFVDYPIRTLTMASFFAFCCAVLSWRPNPPRASGSRARRTEVDMREPAA